MAMRGSLQRALARYTIAYLHLLRLYSRWLACRSRSAVHAQLLAWLSILVVVVVLAALPRWLSALLAMAGIVPFVVILYAKMRGASQESPRRRLAPPRSSGESHKSRRNLMQPRKPQRPHRSIEREIILAVVVLYVLIAGVMIIVHYAQPKGQPTATSSQSPSHK